MKAFGDLLLFLWSVQPSPIPFQAQTRSCSLLNYFHIPTHFYEVFFPILLTFLNGLFYLFCTHTIKNLNFCIYLRISKPRTHEKCCIPANLFGLLVGLAEQSYSTVMCFLQLHDVLISKALFHMASRAVGGR